MAYRSIQRQRTLGRRFRGSGSSYSNISLNINTADGDYLCESIKSYT